MFKEKAVLTILLLCSLQAFSQTESRSNSNVSATSFQTNSIPVKKKYLLKTVLMTSRAAKQIDFRSLKNTASDDSGSFSESSTVPNFSYATLFAVVAPHPQHQVMLIGLQSFDSQKVRTISSPFGKDFILPGSITAVKYSYQFIPKWSLDAKEVYLDTYYWSDPSFGLSFKNIEESGDLQKASISLSVPATQRSQNDKLFTRAVMRAFAMHNIHRTSLFTGATHSRPFYQTSTTSSSSHSNSGSSGPPGGGGYFRPEEIDMVLMDRESSRTMGNIGASYLLNEKTKLNTSASLAYIRTDGEKEIWFSIAKPIGITYAIEDLEIGSDITMYSEIQNYKSPTLPSSWNIGLRASYSFGEKTLLSR